MNELVLDGVDGGLVAINDALADDGLDVMGRLLAAVVAGKRRGGSRGWGEGGWRGWRARERNSGEKKNI